MNGRGQCGEGWGGMGCSTVGGVRWGELVWGGIRVCVDCGLGWLGWDRRGRMSGMERGGVGEEGV